jgi:hypothetical protein
VHQRSGHRSPRILHDMSVQGARGVSEGICKSLPRSCAPGSSILVLTGGSRLTWSSFAITVESELYLTTKMN